MVTKMVSKIIGLLIFEACLVVPADAQQSGFNCNQTVVARVVSRDDMYDAIVTERVCSNSGFGSTVILNEISVVKHGNSVAPSDVVYTVEIGSDMRAYVGWVALNRLWIYTPELKVRNASIPGPFGIEATLKQAPRGVVN